MAAVRLKLVSVMLGKAVELQRSYYAARLLTLLSRVEDVGSDEGKPTNTLLKKSTSTGGGDYPLVLPDQSAQISLLPLPRGLPIAELFGYNESQAFGRSIRSHSWRRAPRPGLRFGNLKHPLRFKGYRRQGTLSDLSGAGHQCPGGRWTDIHMLPRCPQRYS